MTEVEGGDLEQTLLLVVVDYEVIQLVLTSR